MMPPLPRFERACVAVAGDVMLDRYWSGTTARISPEAPVPVVRVSAVEERPGGAANVALNIATLGATVRLVGIVGEDPESASLRRCLSAAGIAHELLPDPECRTVTKLRVLSRHQQLLRIDFEDSFAPVHATALLAAAGRALDGARALVLSDYAKGTLADPAALLGAAAARGVPVLVDPKGRDWRVYRGAALLTPNLQEFEAIAGPCATLEELERRARELAGVLGLGALLVTRGEHGMSLVPREGEALHLGARAVEVYDVTGAGDTVIATVAAALAAGATLADAVACANAAAGIAVGRLGAAAVRVEELREALLGAGESVRGILDDAGLDAALARARSRGERIVMTNGCFDLLHAGHVQLLQQARALGDRLLVAVNDDASVRRLKGAERPCNPLAQRMTLLAALGAVDWVVAFAEDTPEALLRRVRPELLVKGGDYRADEVIGRDIVIAQGGEVRVLDYLEGCSSTALIAAARGAAGD